MKRNVVGDVPYGGGATNRDFIIHFPFFFIGLIVYPFA